MAKGTLPGRLVSKSELCGIFGLSYSTIEQWLNQGCPYNYAKDDDGSPKRSYQFDTAVVRRWREDKVVEEALATEGVASGDKQKTLEGARQRKTEAEASMAEIDLALKSGEAVLLRDVTKQWSQLISNCRAKLLGMPSKVAPTVAIEDDMGKCRRIVEDAILEALSELDHYDPKAKIQDFEGGEEGA